MAAVSLKPEEIVAQESAGRLRATLAAFAAAVLMMTGVIVEQATLSDRPVVFLVDALRDAAGQPLPGGTGLTSAGLLYRDDHATGLIAVGFLLAFAALALIPVLLYLYRAVKVRREEIPGVALIMAIGGPIFLAVAELSLRIGLVATAHDFATSADHSSKAAHDAQHAGIVLAGYIMHVPAFIAVGFAFVLICLNAMRAGLLTRFMGVLGIITGVLFVVRIGSPQIVQTFWLIAVGALISGRLPGGLPAAWTEGKAVPWPSQRDLARVREAAEQQRDAEGGADEGGERPVYKKKKRRRR
jgi:hypothetical protein